MDTNDYLRKFYLLKHQYEVSRNTSAAEDDAANILAGLRDEITKLSNRLADLERENITPSLKLYYETIKICGTTILPYDVNSINPRELGFGIKRDKLMIMKKGKYEVGVKFTIKKPGEVCIYMCKNARSRYGKSYSLAETTYSDTKGTVVDASHIASYEKGDVIYIDINDTGYGLTASDFTIKMRLVS